MSKIIKILITVVVVVIITIAVAISLIDINKYKDDVIAIVEETTGRDFNIEGDFNIAISLIPTIVIEDISFGNAEWGSEEFMLKVGRLEVEVSLLPLISGTIQVNRLILVSPEILLETNEQGVGNWILAPQQSVPAEPAETPETGATKLPDFAIDEISITDAVFSYKDGKTGKLTKVTVDEITIDGGGIGDPIELRMIAAYNAIPIQLSGKLGAPEQLINNQNYPVQLTVNISQATINIDGIIAKPLQAEGLDLTLSFQVKTLASLSDLAESELPDFGPIDFSAKLVDSESGYSLNSISLKAANSDLTGDVSVSISGEKPSLTAKLKSNLLDLTAFPEDEQAKKVKPGKDPNAKVFPSDPLPLESLHAANVEISINLKKIHTNAADLENTQLVLKLNNGKLSINPLNTNVAGGKLESTFTLDGSSGKSASFTLNLSIKDLQPGLLTGLQGKITGAKTNLSMNTRGSGQSIAEIMAGLNGKILLKIDKGLYTGEKKAPEDQGFFSKTFGLLNPNGEAGQGTHIECVVINLDIKDGVSSIDRRIGLATDSINVIGSGAINFKTEEMDIGVIPSARQGIGINASSLAELVRLRGTFANPKVGTDTKAALKAGLSAGAAVATGGLSLLAQGLFGMSSTDTVTDPCAIAMGIEPEKKTVTTPETEKKSTIDSIKDKLKGLFGR